MISNFPTSLKAEIDLQRPPSFGTLPGGIAGFDLVISILDTEAPYEDKRVQFETVGCIALAPAKPDCKGTGTRVDGPETEFGADMKAFDVAIGGSLILLAVNVISTLKV